MNTFDFVIIGVGIFGILLWIRGCWRQSLSDCGLGLVIGVVACVFYFALFSLTRTAWLATMVFGGFFAALLPFPRFWQDNKGRVLASILLLLITASTVAEYKYVSAGNALLVIEPYRVGKGWAFDEPHLGLMAEPFVQGIPEMIDKLVAGIPGSDRNVRLIFSQRAFPGAQIQLDRLGEQDGGNWYYSKEYQLKGWLCPALFKFFHSHPIGF